MDLKKAVDKVLDANVMQTVRGDGNLTGKYRRALWEVLTKFDAGCKHGIPSAYKGLEFGGMVSTDGYSVSAHYVSSAVWGKSLGDRPRTGRVRGDASELSLAPHLDDLHEVARHALLDTASFKLLFGDPGKDDIMYIGDGSRVGGGRCTSIRYTRRQRNLETGRTKRASLMVEQLQRCIPQHFSSPFRTYQEAQDSLKGESSRTCYADRFRRYLIALKLAAPSMRPFYASARWRAAKFTARGRVRSSETKFWNRVAATFPLAEGQRYALISGDWGVAPNLRNSQPTPGVGFLRRCPFRAYRCGERRTSGTCHGCGAWRTSNPVARTVYLKKRWVERTVHNLLRCPNEQCTSRWWQRNANGMLNIRENALHCLQFGRRSDKFSLSDEV